MRFAGDLRGLPGFAVADQAGFRPRFDDDLRQDAVPLLGGDEILFEWNFNRLRLYAFDSFGHDDFHSPSFFPISFLCSS